MLKAALLDMYNGENNRGIPMLKNLLHRYADTMVFDHFDVRARTEVADLSYDIYVFSGGPGDPLEQGGKWQKPYFDLIESLWQYNERTSDPSKKKYVFFICHSFQMACHHFGLGEVSERFKMSFGTYPVHKTAKGKEEAFFRPLSEPFYIADFRRYQVTKPNTTKLRAMGAAILCLEKLRPHVNLERAIMAIRFSPEMIGTQFHPEADPDGLLTHFMDETRKKSIIDEHGEARYNRMLKDLANPMKIQRTFETIIPSFLEHSIGMLQANEVYEMA